MTNFWHPYADMSAVATGTVRMCRGSGAYLWDDEERRYLDGTAALWFCHVGYGREELAQVAARQMEELAAYSTFGEMTNGQAEELATKVCQMSPMGEGAAAFFTSGGSDAIDTAAKLVRRYWIVKGQPRRQTFIARVGGYHGVNGFGTSLGGLEANRSGYGELVGDIVHVPYDDLGALETAMEDAGDRLAAVIGEPVLGAAGVRIAPDEYWADAAGLVESYGALLVLDEVITGFGRLGTAFAAQRFGITPDLIVGAKGITSGYLPLGVVIAAPGVRETLWGESAGLIRHGYTYSGHATACAVALANLRIIDDEGLIDRVRTHEHAFASALDQLDSLDEVKETRAIGYMGAVELSEELIAREPHAVEDVVRAARGNGLLVRNLMGRSLQVSPPLITGPEEFSFLADALATSIAEVAGDRPRRATAAIAAKGAST